MIEDSACADYFILGTAEDGSAGTGELEKKKSSIMAIQYAATNQP